MKIIKIKEINLSKNDIQYEYEVSRELESFFNKDNKLKINYSIEFCLTF